MIIEEIEKQIINLLPTSNILLDEVDYSILEERKKDWKNSRKLRTVLCWRLIATLKNLYLFLITFLNYMGLIPIDCL